MKEIILGLAETADPLEADALRTIAANYPDKPKRTETFPELSRRQIFLVAALVYVVWTPIFFWLGFGFPKVIEPPGTAIEQLTGFIQEQDGRWTTRTYRFAPAEDFSSGVRKFVFKQDPVPLVVYEDLVALPKENYEFQEINPKNIWRYVTIKTGDGTDPNKNGRKYYAVSP